MESVSEQLLFDDGDGDGVTLGLNPSDGDDNALRSQDRTGESVD